MPDQPSLRERVKSRISQTRQDLRDFTTQRHDAPVNSAERKVLAKHVKAERKRLTDLQKRLAKIDARHAADQHAAADWNGHTPVLGAVGEFLVKKAAEFGLVVTATTDGQHASTSYHYLALAIDFGVVAALVGTSEARTREIAFQNWLDKAFPHSAEIFGPDSHYIKNGVRYAGMFPDHGDHVHIGKPAK